MSVLIDWWPVWLTIVGLGFAVPEGVAIANKTPGDTLSERTRAFFRTKTRAGKTVFIAFWLALAGVWAWFLPHIIGG